MQQKEKKKIEQVEYLGRWINKEHFRVFVYATDGSEKLANNWDEYRDLINTGEWFSTKELNRETIETKVERIEDIKKAKNQFKSGRRSRNL